jgi:hypothetical protein
MPILTVPLNTASHFPARPPGPAIADDKARERQHFQTSFFPPGVQGRTASSRARGPTRTHEHHALAYFLLNRGPQ